jgi:hypothetical protein
MQEEDVRLLQISCQIFTLTQNSPIYFSSDTLETNLIKEQQTGTHQTRIPMTAQGTKLSISTYSLQATSPKALYSTLNAKNIPSIQLPEKI